MLKKIFTLLLLLIQFILIRAQDIDVQHYKFQLTLSDESDSIKGIAEISIKFLQPVKQFTLDLVQRKSNGKGMTILNISGEKVTAYTQNNDKIIITLKDVATINTVQSFTIKYSGIPADGLIISKNKFGDRTFFADNWPDRAHHWIPCNDIPDDKTSVEFIVTAPDHYQIISNGIKVDETNAGHKKTTHWKEDIPLPTKVMVVGAADFAVARLDSNAKVPVTAWVYPQNKQAGFYDYGVAPGIVQFFSNYIAAFPYQKLANVQSKTIFGGMENASCIFYAESSVTGDRKWEDVIAHEIAHQWFGDMATEKKFAHLWLSEGFATYMTDIYLENKYGRDSLAKRLQKERRQVIQFDRNNKKPVVDSTSGLMDLLNANSYQKGAWVLHMLRHETGDTVFQKIIQNYYQQYKGSNADTRDFEAIAEKISGKNLQSFFDQWLYRQGVPKVEADWHYDNNGGITFLVRQTTDSTYHFPLEVGIILEDGKVLLKKYEINEALTIIKQKAGSRPVKIILDPNTNLLFEGKLTEAGNF